MNRMPFYSSSFLICYRIDNRYGGKYLCPLSLYMGIIMERIDRILQNEAFKEHVKKNRLAEVDRIFCKHDLQHFLDVARIAMVINLEKNLGVDRELIYAAALLHDLGRHEQYENGTPHEEAGARIARKIMEECGFEEAQIIEVVDAIADHRGKKGTEVKGTVQGTVKELLYTADKASRACFACSAKDLCNWSDEKKNLQIKY